MVELKLKEEISQEPSKKYFDLVHSVFKKSSIPKVEGKIDLAHFTPVHISVNDDLSSPKTEEMLLEEVEKKINTLMFFDKAVVDNTNDVVSIIISGYVEKFNPVRYLLFVRKVVKDMIYDSHKVDITTKERDKKTVFIMYSYTRDFQELLFNSMKRLINKFDQIKEYEIIQNKNSLDCFEISIIGKLLK